MEINRGLLIAQGINFLVILFLFKWLVGDRITKAIRQRRADLAKAEGASKVYEDILEQAEEEKQKLIGEGLAHKNKLIEEAKQVADQKAEDILTKADQKAKNIVDEAEEQANQLEKDLEAGFVDGVKATTHKVVKRLFDKDPSLKEKYVDSLVTEYTKQGQ